MPKSLIDVGIISHNHEKSIETCIRSVYQQSIINQANIIVIDDCSTDNTENILTQLQHEFKFKLLRNSTNLGVIETAKRLYSEITAKYFCWLDGDDYWTHPEKLKTQIDFLESNPEYNACFHDAEILQENFENSEIKQRTQYEHRLYSQFNAYKTDISPEDIIQRLIIPTASLVFKYQNNCVNWNQITYPHSLAWIIHLNYIKNSKFYYFNEAWSVYRDHPEGFSKKTPITEFKRHNIQTLEKLITDNFYTNYKHHIYKSLAKEYSDLLFANQQEKLLSAKAYKTAIKLYKKYMTEALELDVKYFKQHKAE
jgi:glycosyltransferase involved in cell wall biosynthesis